MGDSICQRVRGCDRVLEGVRGYVDWVGDKGVLETLRRRLVMC